MLINNPVVTGSFIVNGVNVAGITGSSALSSSYLTTSASYAAASASLSTRVTNLEGTASVLTTASASFAVVSSSFATTSGSAASRLNVIETSYATTGSNNFTGRQYVSDVSNAIGFASTASLYSDGGLRISKDSFVSGTAYFNNVVVYGTSSIQYITSSQINIGANIINLNTDTPAVRFGGMAVADSGSNPGITGSMLWDSQANHWVYSNPSGSTYSGGMLISGPRASSLGTEVGTTACAVMIGQGSDHITSSAIFSYGNATCFYGNSFVNSSGLGCFTSVCSPSFVGGTLTGTSVYASTVVCAPRTCIVGAGGGDFVALFQNTTSATPYGVWIKDASGPSGGYPLFNITDNAGTTVYLRTDSSTGNTALGTSPTTARLFISGSNNGTLLQAASPGASSALFISGSGYVGIGTSSPQATLDVRGKYYSITSVADNIIEVINSDTTNGYGLYVRAGGTNTNRYSARFKNGADQDVMWVGISNVGIGCSNPANSKLLVAGTHASGNSILGVVPVGNNVATIGLYNSSATRTALFYSDTGFVTIETDADPLLLRTAGVNRLCIGSTGIATFSCQVCAAGFYASTVQSGITIDSTTNGDTIIASRGLNAALHGIVRTVGQNGVTCAMLISTRDSVDGNLPASVNALWGLTNHSIVIATNNTERMRITSAGRVGIGTTGPAADLQVNRNGEVTFALANNASITSGNRGSIQWYNSSDSTVASIRAVAVTDNVGTDLQFYTRPAAGSLTERMLITSVGGLQLKNNYSITLNSTATTTLISSLPLTTSLLISVVINWTSNSAAQRTYLLHVGATTTAWGSPNSGITTLSSLDWSSGYVGAATFAVGGSGGDRTLTISVAGANTYNVDVNASMVRFGY